jgi:hypothetical protein
MEAEVDGKERIECGVGCSRFKFRLPPRPLSHAPPGVPASAKPGFHGKAVDASKCNVMSHQLSSKMGLKYQPQRKSVSQQKDGVSLESPVKIRDMTMPQQLAELVSQHMRGKRDLHSGPQAYMIGTRARG